MRPAFIDHVTLTVRDLDASRRFYAAALAPWGAVEQEIEGEFAFGPPGAEDFVVRAGTPPTTPVHVAFRAPDKETVHAFHAAALAAGATDNGPPGPRRYSSGYFAAFVLDPDGHNVEAVFHDPPE